MNEKILVIVNASYPFDNGESFMENEIPFIKQFDKVIICPCSVVDFNQKRKINNSLVTVYPLSNPGRLIKLFKYIKSIFYKITIDEILLLKKNKKLNMYTLKELLSFVSVGQTSYKKIKKYLLKNGINKTDNIIFYSYWMSFHAYTGLLLKNSFLNSKAVTRCHGFDLYEYRNKNSYIPLRKLILNNQNIVFSISSDGKNYLETEYPNIQKNIEISRLGTLDRGIRKAAEMRNPFKIVSCSNVVSVKRVDKIVDALSKIKNIKIEWTHFGNGILFENVKKYAEKCLDENIKFNLNGALSNQELQQQYAKTDFDVFINVSESEGIPVSIMEAISFGIPVIATDVGGVNEIVYNDQNGILLDKDFSDNQLIEAINKFAFMPNDEYLKYRDNARNIWEKNYDAEKNYAEFLNEISRL